MTYSTKSLSGSVDDKPINITAIDAATAQTIHTSVDNGTDFDEIELSANNHTGTDLEIVILIGGTTALEEIKKTIPANDTKLVLPGYKMGLGQTVKAFCLTAGAINLFGKVGRTTS